MAVNESPKPHLGVMPLQPPVPVHALEAAGSHEQARQRRAAGIADRAEDGIHEATDPGTLGAISELFPLCDSAKALDLVRDGLSFSVFESLVRVLGVQQKEVASVIGIPATTLSRRKRSGRLTLLESDRLLRIARLVEMAHCMMRSDVVAARRWLTSPHDLLGGARPLAHASTETGGREVEQLIGRLRHGTFS